MASPCNCWRSTELLYQRCGSRCRSSFRLLFFLLQSFFSDYCVQYILRVRFCLFCTLSTARGLGFGTCSLRWVATLSYKMSCTRGYKAGLWPSAAWLEPGRGGKGSAGGTATTFSGLARSLWNDAPPLGAAMVLVSTSLLRRVGACIAGGWSATASWSLVLLVRSA